jgi:hypothetical protein
LEISLCLCSRSNLGSFWSPWWLSPKLVPNWLKNNASTRNNNHHSRRHQPHLTIFVPYLLCILLCLIFGFRYTCLSLSLDVIFMPFLKRIYFYIFLSSEDCLVKGSISLLHALPRRNKLL